MKELWNKINKKRMVILVVLIITALVSMFGLAKVTSINCKQVFFMF